MAKSRDAWKFHALCARTAHFDAGGDVLQGFTRWHGSSYLGGGARSCPAAEGTPQKSMVKNIPFTFRWPIKQTGEREIVVSVPTGGDVSILSAGFLLECRLSADELETAEVAVLKSVSIIQ